jgi:hypothetical protein
MNERIKELIEQATLIYPEFYGTDRREFDVEKFAELIVDECLAMCVVESDDISLDYKRGVIFAMSRCQHNIKNYFGVKE